MAASMAPRSAAFSDGISAEQEQDANSALTELDKGLRSGRIGVQCEAIVKFPRLFEKYPFPILINSALLKIADVYRSGNNFIRLCILRVVQQSEKHLDKILNVDEFVRRIYGVYHCNDPIARAITVRTLGSIASVIPERKNIHHSIILALDSHDAVEVEAAIFAADKFSENSKTFSATICSKMIAMLSGLATPMEMKMKLIPSLRHMHHDADTAAKAFAVCESLLEGYPAQSFVILTLNTMSWLAVHSLVNMAAHVGRLLAILNSDLRCGVHLTCLHNLQLLARRGPHLWQASNVEEVGEFLMKTTYPQLKVQAVCVLNAICGSVAVHLLPWTTVNKMLTIGRQFCYDDNVVLASKAIRLMTAISQSKRCDEDIGSEAVSAIQTFLILSTDGSAENQQHLKSVVKAAVDLSATDPAVGAAFVSTLTSLLSTSSGGMAEMVCEALTAIGDRTAGLLQEGVPTVLACLDRWSSTGLDSHSLQVQLCTVVFQVAGECMLPMDVLASLRVVVDKSGPWQMYQISRQAMRYGQYSFAEFIFSHLAHKVASEHYYHWLHGLKHVCAAQLKLSSLKADGSNIQPCLAATINSYQRALVSLKAASTPGFPLEFQCEYIRIRTRWLCALRLLLLTANTFRSSPPPAIASAQASTNGQESTRWAQVVQQMEKCVQKCHETGQQISALYWSSFDADPSSLSNIMLLQQGCDCIKSAISTIISTVNTGQSTMGERQYLGHLKGDGKERSMQQVLHNISRDLDILLPENSTSSEKNYKLVCLCPQLIDFLTSSAQALVQASLPFPRFFFQTLQSTTVKLALSPQASLSGEPVLIRSDTNLALKVEGVIQRGERPALFRSVHSVRVTLTTSLLSRAPGQPQAPQMKNPAEKTGVQLSQTVEPHNEYFSTNFVLPFPVLGLHSVLVEAAIVDENGACWKTGPRTTLSVKSYNDALQSGRSGGGVSRSHVSASSGASSAH
ncbi:integrator complex subunit 7-like isoform X2 [Babylonia areolata]|uniref:integrator complex subunit 7-like isoform X2 n=1 Tax=Babylonia areolata TaxID=304850 RepID=UPI003FD4C8EC